MQWVFRCDVRRRTLSIIPTTATKCPLLYVRLSRLNLICRPGSAAPPSLFCSAEKLNDLLRGEQFTVRT